MVCVCVHVRECKCFTHHFLDCLSLGGGLRGIRKSALIGCMLHRAVCACGGGRKCQQSLLVPHEAVCV